MPTIIKTSTAHTGIIAETNAPRIPTMVTDTIVHCMAFVSVALNDLTTRCVVLVDEFTTD